MGLFVADGRYQGWLSFLLCCCVALGDDEHPNAKVQTPRTGADARSEQAGQDPLPSSTRQWRLSLGSSTNTTSSATALIAPSKVDKNNVSSLPRPNHTQAPASQSQTPFRRSGSTDRLRTGLVPLRLAPIVLKEAPHESELAQDAGENISERTRSESMQSLLPLATQQSQDRPAELAGRRRPLTDQEPYRVVRRGEQHIGHYRDRQRLVTRSRSAHSDASSEGSSRQSRTASTINSPVDSLSAQSKLLRSRPHRSSRSPSLERTGVSVESEVLELNTIVEERRGDPDSPSNMQREHVAAIAPTMRASMRCRWCRSAHPCRDKRP